MNDWWSEINVRKTRIIPVLLLDNDGFYKTIKFKNEEYLGDPLNILKIFNEKEVDEIMLVSYRASAKKRKINFNYLKELVSVCRFPVTYGGGVDSLKTIEKLFRIGIEKVLINSAIHSNEQLLYESVQKFGSSSIVGCIEISSNWRGKTFPSYNSALKSFRWNLDAHVDFLNSSGVGETLIIDVNREGTMAGLNEDLLTPLANKLESNVIVNGGIGVFDHIVKFQNISGVKAFGVGSLVVYHGNNKGILINTPSKIDLNRLL